MDNLDNKHTKQPRVTSVLIEPSGYLGRRNRYYNSYRNRRDPGGLLFERTDELTATQLINSPDVRSVFGDLLVVEDLDNGLLVHSDISQLPTPDRATADDVLSYVADGKLHRFPVLRRFSQCMEPTRDILGCQECSHKGVPCLTGQVHGTDVLPISKASEGLEIKDLQAKFQDRKTTVAGHIYVSPVMVAQENETFVRGFRDADSIEWAAEEGRRETRRKSAAKGAATRSFKKTACSKCPAREGGCVSWNWCKGPFPTSEEITRQVLAAWEPYLTGEPNGLTRDGTKRTKLELWQLYAIMNMGGTIGSACYNRRRVVLGRLARSGEGVLVRVVAYKPPTDSDYLETTDWKLLRKLFPELPEGPGTRASERPSDEALAYYFGGMEQGRLGARRRGFHGYISDPIGWMRTRMNGVEVGRCRPYYVPLSYPETVRSWSEFYTLYADMPVNKQEIDLG